jgi:uncharacterized spore protein YtfJ
MKGQETIERVRDALSARSVFAEPYEKNGLTVIPAASVRGGGGQGKGESPDGTRQGEGSGFGLSARPVGAYVIEDGTVTWKPAFDRNRAIALGAVVALAMLWTFGRIAKARAKRADREAEGQEL